MALVELLLIASIPVVLTAVLLAAVVTRGDEMTEASAPADRRDDPSAALPPARLRVVTITRERDVLAVDGVVDASGPGVRVPVGTPITLEIGAPESFWLDLSIERLVDTWAADNRVIDVALRDHPSGRVVSLRSRGSVVNLPLVGETELWSG